MELNSNRRLLSVKDFSKAHPSFPEGGLRFLIFNAKARKNSRGETIPGNRLAEFGAIVRLGRKVLIDEQKFFAWLDARQDQAA